MNQLKTGLLLLAAGLAAVASAKELTPAEALGRLNQGQVSPMTRAKAERLNPVPAHTTRTVSGEAAVYIFSGSEDGGYLVLSADDNAVPLLGYSDSGSFSTDRIPPQMQWWLDEYAAQIEYARRNGTSTDGAAQQLSFKAQKQAIEPMLKTKWDQVAPYNLQCPLEGTERTWTGCAATSIAQVMKYFEYPVKGTGSITYAIESLEKKVTLDFSKEKFDWDNMLDTYIEGEYDQTQADAVAYLMKACGYAVKMQYSLDASGALALNFRNGLVKYFDYDPNTLYALRSYYSTTQWNEMIYENLKNVGPVVYGGGSALGGGHSFVCDGYDGNGLFHFNWGWSGISDGYFTLEALNPGSLGIGGGTGGGYNFTQDALIGLQPNKGGPVEERPVYMTQEGELTATLTGTTLKLGIANTANPGWVNYNPNTLICKFGVMFEPQGDTPGNAVYQELTGAAVQIEPGYGVYLNNNNGSIDLSKANLSNGTYKVVAGCTIVSRATMDEPTDGSEWVAVKPCYGLPNYVTIKVDNGKYTLTTHLLPPLKITGEFTSPLYYGCLAKVKVTVENTADVDRVSGFAPIIANDEAVLLLGESVFVDIPAHSTVTREWVTDLEQFVQYFDPYLNVPLVFSFFNEETYDFYLDDFQAEVTVLDTPTQPKVTVANFNLPDATVENDIFTLPNPNDIKVSADLSIYFGYFAYNIFACLCEPYEGNQVAIVESASMPVFLNTQNRKIAYDVSICYPVANTDQVYYVVLAYSAPGGLVQLSDLIPVKFKKPSGVDTVADDSGIRCVTDRAARTVTLTAGSVITSVETFDLTGRATGSTVTLDGTSATVALTTSGVTIISVRDSEGNHKVFKVAL